MIGGIPIFLFSALVRAPLEANDDISSYKILCDSESLWCALTPFPKIVAQCFWYTLHEFRKHFRVLRSFKNKDYIRLNAQRIYSRVPIIRAPVIRVSALTEPSNVSRFFFLKLPKNISNLISPSGKRNPTTLTLHFSLYHAYVCTPPLLLKGNYWIAQGQGSKTESCNKS